jgi:L-threonylcarbamoyladenylate synthase
MQTEILHPSDLTLAIASLKKGDPVVFPTETVYGLGAPIFNEKAIREIFVIKGRPLDNPLIAHVFSMQEVDLLAEDLPESFYTLAEKFWPGPLTIVVKKSPLVPSIVSAGHPTIAIRMPSHPVARELLKQVQEPLVAPSANLSGKPSPTCLSDVLEDLSGKVRFIVDGGECDVGIESTVISLYHKTPTLLRPGVITCKMLEEVLGKKVELAPKTGPVLSPGMKYRHYAPKASISLVYNRDDLKEGPTLYPAAKTIYAQLRETDRKGIKEIQIYCNKKVQQDEALMNRLLRASGQTNYG